MIHVVVLLSYFSVRCSIHAVDSIAPSYRLDPRKLRSSIALCDLQLLSTAETLHTVLLRLVHEPRGLVYVGVSSILKA